MAKMTGFKYFNGTKAAFESKASQYADAIVFISGGADSKGSCIFAQGMYFGNFAEFLATINYVKGVKVGDSQYNATAGGGYIPFAPAANSEVSLNVENGTITVGLTEAFVNKVNNTASDLGGKNDAASSTGSAFARIANLAKLVSDLTGGSVDSIEGQITNAINALRTEITGDLSDTTDAKTLAAINDELNGLDAKVKSLEDAGFIKIGDVQSEIAKLGGEAESENSKVHVVVKTEGGQVTSVFVDEADLDDALGNKADLDESGKILASQFPDYILGQVMFGGLIDANSAVIPTENFSNKYGISDSSIIIEYNDNYKYEGVYFIATENGTILANNVQVGDWIISSGSSWEKIDNTDAVASVAGLTGSITASALAQKLAETGDANELALKSEVDAVEVTASGDNTLITASVSDKRAVSVAPTEKLTSAVAKAETAYQKPDDGIPSNDFTQSTQAALAKGANAIQSVDSDSEDFHFVKIHVSEQTTDDNREVLIHAGVNTHSVADAVASDTEAGPDKTDGLAVASDVKSYVDSQWEWEVIS